MTLEERKATFQLIKKPRPALPFEDRSFDTPSQATLFPMQEPDLLIFLYFPFVTAEEFTRTLELARPAAVLELRRSPRFDFGHLNRQQVFRIFDAIHSTYYDLGPMESSSDRYASDPVQLVGAFLRSASAPPKGPVLILLNQKGLEIDDSIPADITGLFATASNHPWRTYTVVDSRTREAIAVSSA